MRISYYLLFCLISILPLSNISFSQYDDLTLLSTEIKMPNDTYSVDLDLDGDNDLLISGNYDNEISWFENLGGGVFGKEQVISSLCDLSVVVFAIDLDGDLDIDVISASKNDTKIAWYENLGGAVFGPQQIISSNFSNASTIDAFDVDGDLDIDIISASSTDDKIVWWENLGAGTFGAEQIISNLVDNPRKIYSEDIDGDLDLDILCASYSDSLISWYENIGGGIFGAQQVISSDAKGAASVSAIDIDGDLDFDVVYLYNGIAAWQENIGAGVFGPPTSIDTLSSMSDINVSDFNLDGYMDFVVFNSHGGIYRYLNNGSGVFTLLLVAENLDNPTSIFVSDLNGDGYDEIIGTTHFDNDLFYYENQGGVSFSDEVFVASEPAGPFNLMAADFDGDSDQDILAISKRDSKVVWYENLGSMEFSKEKVLAFKGKDIQAEEVGASFGDFDNDGDIDIVAVFTIDSSVIILPNLGGGNFGTEIVISDSIEASDVAVFDLDYDGDFDIVCTDIGGNKVVWYENLGAMSFSGELLLSANETGALEVIIRDMNNDGLNDIICQSAFLHQIWWYENQGNGSFGIRQTLFNAGFNFYFEIADIDNDGDQDIIIANITSNYLIWNENLGGGNFILNSIGFFSSIWSLAIADIDLDNDLDIICQTDFSEISWIENLGSGSFGPQHLITNTIGSNYLTTADIDGDGDQDVLGSTDDFGHYFFENQLINDIQLQGRVYIDMNQNQINDSTDVGLTQIQILSNPQSDFTYTYQNGEYYMNFSDTNGVYQIVPDNLQYWSIVTDSLSFTVNIDSSQLFIDSLDFGLYPDTVVYEVNPELIGSFPRCNTTTNYWVNVQNVGSSLPSGVITLTLDDSISYVNSAVTPDSIIGQNIYWHIDSLMYFTDTLINVEVQMPNFNSIGDYVYSYINVSVTDSVGNFVSNFQDSLVQVISCAYDPNDKTASPIGIDSLGFIDADTSELEYTIRFQNTGNDTALVIVIQDQLDVNLDWLSLTPLGSSHDVQISVQQNGLMTLTFDGIMLPDSAVDELGSHGFFRYGIDIKSGIPIGTSIYNTAEIYFDFNPPIITNTKIHTLYDCGNIFGDFTTMDTQICKNSTVIAFPDMNTTVLDWSIASGESGLDNYFLWLADSSGTFNLNINASNNFCSNDTIISLNVIDEIPLQNLIPGTICQGDSVLLFGQYQSVAGIYLDTLQSVVGCDSVVSKEIFTLPSFETFETIQICQGDSVLIFGQHESFGGIYLDNLQSIEGCDSILNIELIISPEFTSSEYIIICDGDSVLLFGQYQSVAGIYLDTLQSLVGCDSILQKIVSLVPLPTVSIGMINQDTLCINSNSVFLNNETPLGGTYSGQGINVNEFDPQISGIGIHTIYYNYIDLNGCSNSDSTQLMVDGCLGIEELDFEEIRIYPNPFKDYTMIHFGKNFKGNYSIELYNALGQLVKVENSINEVVYKLERGNLTRGEYSLRVLNVESAIIFNSKLIIQ